MKRLLIGSFLIGLATPTFANLNEPDLYLNPLNQNQEIHISHNDPLLDVENAIRVIGSRLEFGVSLKDLNSTFLPLVDSLAIAKSTNPSNPAVIKGEKIINLFLPFQKYWKHEIENANQYYSVTKGDELVSYIVEFNKLYASINADKQVELPQIRSGRWVKQYPAEKARKSMYQNLKDYINN